MDTSDSVGWFVVDMRDLAGQRQQERWVKLQGASPAEVLISSSLAMARDPQQDSSKESLEQQHGRPTTSGSSSSRTGGRRVNLAGKDEAQASGEMPSPVVDAAATTVTAAPSRLKPKQPSPVLAEMEVKSLEEDEGGVVAIHAHGSSYSGGSSSSFNTESAAVLSTSAAEAVSELDALPVGPGADGADARTFSLAISVMGAAGLSPLTAAAATAATASSADVVDGVSDGFWLSYSIFGVVVQTDRFERQVPPPPGDRAVLEPMMDSFRLRATLQGLCQFLGEAPPLQVGRQIDGCTRR